MNLHHLIESRPILDTLQLIGGKWNFLILYSLCEGKKRFKDLLRDLDGISARKLSQELKLLEENGLVLRTPIATVPVTVEYEITAYGQTLEPVLLTIQAWGKDHRQYIKDKIRRGQ